MSIKFYKYSETGPRFENQDSLDAAAFDNSFYACIADGVGGSNCGKIASQESVSFFISQIISGKTNLKEIIISTHERLKNLQNSNIECSKMATTFTGCIIFENSLTAVHVGDSRLCILRGNGIKQLTEDQTEVDRLLKSGKIKYKDVETYPRKHIIESAIGASDFPTIQTFNFELVQGDRVLITTDGVHELISKVEFRDLSVRNKDINSFGLALVNLLNTRKLTDNASFILISVE